MSVYYVVFGLVLNRGGEDFVPFLLSGIVIWKWFVSSVNQGSVSILNNTGLLRQVYLPKYIFPISILLTNTIRFFFVFLLLLIFFFLYGIPPNITWLGLPLLLIAQFLLIAALSGFFAVFVPFLPDLKLLIENLMILLFFLSGIFFYISSLPEKLQTYFMLNPMAFLIEQYRGILLYARWPVYDITALIIIVSLIVIGVNQWLMQRFDRHFPKVLM